jgi:hypothetical protein
LRSAARVRRKKMAKMARKMMSWGVQIVASMTCLLSGPGGPVAA